MIHELKQPSPLQRLALFGRMIKFSHSVFALPFALTAGVVAFYRYNIHVRWYDALLLLVCMVSARTTAMGFNRLVDRKMDALNPRTSARELPSGVVRVTEARLLTILAAITFVVAAYVVNPLCGALAVPILLLLCGYSLTKRYTSLSHFVLGMCLGCAPVGVWFAMTGTFAWAPIILGLGVTFWTAGFDIYYSCQDEAFDKEHGLHSLPASVGSMNAIRMVTLIHTIAVIAFVLFGLILNLGGLYYAGVWVVAAILAYEAWLLRKGDLSNINLAFFNLNGYVSIVFVAATWLDAVFNGKP